MGGDVGLRSTIPASILALNENSQLHITLVGDEPAIRQQLEKARFDSPRLTVHHAPDVVPMDEKPAQALRSRPQSSMAVALELLRDGKVGGVLSAGNTGALDGGVSALRPSGALSPQSASCRLPALL